MVSTLCFRAPCSHLLHKHTVFRQCHLLQYCFGPALQRSHPDPDQESLQNWACLPALQFQRLRFDFNLPRSVTPDEIRQIEGLVNLWIQEDHSLSTTVVPLAEAKAKGELQLPGCCVHAPDVCCWLRKLAAGALGCQNARC